MQKLLTNNSKHEGANATCLFGAPTLSKRIRAYSATPFACDAPIDSLYVLAVPFV